MIWREGVPPRGSVDKRGSSTLKVRKDFKQGGKETEKGRKKEPLLLKKEKLL